MNNRIRANIQVGANWEEFQQKARHNNTSASELIRKWINAYLADSETIASQASPNWIEEKTLQMIRQELPPNLEAVTKMIKTYVTSELDRFKQDLTQSEHLNQATIDINPVQNRSDNIILSSASDCLDRALDLKDEIASSGIAVEQIERSDLSEIIKDDIPAKDGIMSSEAPGKSDVLTSKPKIISNRELGRLIGKHHVTLSRWRRRWGELPSDHEIKLSGWQPTPDGKWVKFQDQIKDI